MPKNQEPISPELEKAQKILMWSIPIAAVALLSLNIPAMHRITALYDIQQRLWEGGVIAWIIAVLGLGCLFAAAGILEVFRRKNFWLWAAVMVGGAIFIFYSELVPAPPEYKLVLVPPGHPEIDQYGSDVLSLRVVHAAVTALILAIHGVIAVIDEKKIREHRRNLMVNA